MIDRDPKRAGRAVYALAAVALIGLTAYLVFRALAGFDLVDLDRVSGPIDFLQLDRENLLPWALATLLVSLATLGLWLRDRRRAELTEAAERSRERAEQELDRAREELEGAREQLSARQEDLDSVQDTLGVLEEARRREREWNARLHQEIREHHLSVGPLGASDGIPGLVLRMAVELLDAEKGILIATSEDGGREVVAWENFENNPRDSALAKRFTDEALERDTIVRERSQELDDVPEEDATPADQEIDNLIAIPTYVSDEFTGVVVCANSEDIERNDEQVLIALGNQAGAVLENASLRGEVRDAYISTVAVLAEAIRVKDPHLGGHSHEVSSYVRRVAERLGLTGKQQEELVFASLLHDIGKIGISERILLKPGRLTPEEYAVVKLHPRIGAGLVRQVSALSALGQFILHHHEHFDGTGYPTGLRGEEIPLEARVIGVADAFSAMTSDRPYRGRMSLEEASSELEAHAGTQFDPEIVRIFVEEVRANPPGGENNPIREVLADPELESLRGDGESHLVGSRTLELIDNLTLLYTHRYFHEAASAEVERGRVQDSSFAIAVFEIGSIETVNRERGYEAGDAVIKAVAHAVEQQALRYGGTACRYSGRRVGLLLPETNAGEIEVAAAAVTSELAESDVRAGCARWAPSESAEETIARAQAQLREGAAGDSASPAPA